MDLSVENLTLLVVRDFNKDDRRELWDNFCQSEHMDIFSADSFSSSALSSLSIQGFYSHSVMALFTHPETNRKKIVGIFPLFAKKSALFGTYLISNPYFNYGGYRIAHEFKKPVEKMFEEWLNEVMTETGAKRFEIRTNEILEFSTEKKIQCDTHKSNMILDIPQDLHQLGDGNAKSRSKLRSQYGRALREADSLGATLSFKTTGDENCMTSKLLNDFYMIYSQRMRDLGTPNIGLDWFCSFFSNMQPNATVVVAYWNDIPVSGGFLLHTNSSVVSIPWAASAHQIADRGVDINLNRISINSWFYFQIISWCHSRGALYFDFGRSTNNEGTFDFKKQWGAIPQPCYWYSKSSDSKNGLRADNPKYSLAIRVWKKLPVRITRLLGPMLAKSLP